MADQPLHTGHWARTVGFLVLAVGFRVGLQVWVRTGANGGLECLMVLAGGVLVLLCTGFAAGQAALGLLAFVRRRDGP